MARRYPVPLTKTDPHKPLTEEEIKRNAFEFRTLAKLAIIRWEQAYGIKITKPKTETNEVYNSNA